MGDKIEILDVASLAAMLKMDPQTVSRKTQKGEIPGFKIGSRWRFRLSDIEEWINKNMKGNEFGNKMATLLASYFKSRKDIIVAYLFGSHAAGKAGAMSDVDVAVLIKDENKTSLDVQSKMASDIMKLLGAGKVDIVFLNRASPLMAYEVVKDGMLVFIESQFDAVGYKIKVVGEYQDTARIRDLRYNYFLEAA